LSLLGNAGANTKLIIAICSTTSQVSTQRMEQGPINDVQV
jgi:hypothetical protein